MVVYAIASIVILVGILGVGAAAWWEMRLIRKRGEVMPPPRIRDRSYPPSGKL